MVIIAGNCVKLQNVMIERELNTDSRYLASCTVFLLQEGVETEGALHF